jgi:hypothetical protein
LKISVATVKWSIQLFYDFNFQIFDIKSVNDLKFKPQLSSIFLKNFGFKSFCAKTLNQTQIAVLIFN